MGTTGYECVIQLANHITWHVEHHLIARTKHYLVMNTRVKVFAQVGANWTLGFRGANYRK
uniref:Metalloendopeptidase n=1 Tax=Solanum tuberosum TaxID=4113 RepID=M1BEP4_SOLTU